MIALKRSTLPIGSARSYDACRRMHRRPGVWVNYWPCVFQANRSSRVSNCRRRFLLTWTGLGWLLGVVLLAASYPARPAPLKPSLAIQVVFQGRYCGRKGARVEWLDDRLAVERVLGRVRHNRTYISRVLRRLDFARQGVVIIRLRTPPAANSVLTLAQAKVSTVDNALRIHASGREPSPPGPRGVRPATSPCLLAAVPRGGYMVVTVVDTSGAVYGYAKVPGRRTTARDSGAPASVTEHTAAELRRRQ